MQTIKFRTEYTPVRENFTLNPEKPVLLMGSCFADNISQRMQFCRWNACNPFGVLFNPLSIARVLRMSLSGLYADIPDSIFGNEGIFHSWLFDSKKSGSSADEVLDRIAESFSTFDIIIKEAEALFITFGTSWCYFLNEDDYVVANCHKQPQALFNRRRIGIEEIADTWLPRLEELHNRYPLLKVIFPVSPVRHLKDGFEGNARSKAVLTLAIEKLCERYDFCRYFPAYEIVTDDLRDYRFYARDLVHPSDTAVEYIWDVFQETYLDSVGKEKLKSGEKETKRSLHRNIIGNR